MALSKCSAEPNDGWWTNTIFGENTSATGSVRVTPTTSTTYKLICGSVSSQVVVTVSPLPADETPTTASQTTATPTDTSVAANQGVDLPGPTPIDEPETASPLRTGLIIASITAGLLVLIFSALYFLKKRKANKIE